MDDWTLLLELGWQPGHVAISYDELYTASVYEQYTEYRIVYCCLPGTIWEHSWRLSIVH